MFLLTLLFFYLYQNKKTIKTTKSILYIPEKYNGKDQRNTDTEFEKSRIAEDRQNLLKFVINYNKKRLLDLLEDKNISIYRKLYEMNKYESFNKVSPVEIKKGNLYKDFDFEM